MRTCGLRGCFFLVAPLFGDLQNFFPEVFPHNDIDNWVENTVKEGQVSEDLVADVQDIREVTPSQDFSL